MKLFFLLAVSALFTGCCETVTAQVCPTCPTPAVGFVDSPAAALGDAASFGPSSRVAGRVRVGGGCGSGSVVGHWNGGSLIMTNAHVAGTRVGRETTIDCVVNGRGISKTARVVMAAYDDRTLTDWALMFVPDWQEIKPVPMSIDRPSGVHYTTGSPRCVWPMVSSTLRTADIADNSPLWRWRPNAIGGQSGSGIWNESDDKQYGLLTWSWGGLGAGQMTSEIYKQARDQTTAGSPRIAGLSELTNTGVVCENGFFAEAGLTDYPIWDNQSADPDPVDPGNVTDQEAAFLAALKARSEALGLDYGKVLQLLESGTVTETADFRAFQRIRQRAREKSVNWAQLLEFIMQLIEFLSKLD